MTAPSEARCDACGKRGVELHGLDLLDGGQTFAVCDRCLYDARNTCGRVATFELGEAS